MASTAVGQPKKGGSAPKGGTAAPKGGGSGSAAGGADEGIEIDQPAAGSGDSGTIDMEQEEKPQGSLEADLQANDQVTAVKTGPVKKTPISWKDILVVVRKPFLKLKRTELFPFTGITMNDNMITHYTIGGEFAYWMTDVLAIGVEAQYYQHSFGEPFDLVARQARRLPTVNQYNWSSALNFHYVPVYGKFAVLDKKLVAWEVAFTAGVGAGQSEVIPRDTKFPGFTTILIQPNVGASMRFFLAKWLTIQAGIRDYMFIDKFEPTDRSPTMNASASEAKDNADSAFINNIMFQIGVSFWLPTSFEYTTFR
ncbi:MAG TPA: outer membrane beta-barrel domain-containing protein [Kofleriaceae bacterium]|nr:outer membrane beta-barrel domain-containing protein [Kofleriaceae bacterium]